MRVKVDEDLRKYNPILFEMLDYLSDSEVRKMYTQLRVRLEDELERWNRAKLTEEILLQECQKRGLVG